MSTSFKKSRFDEANFIFPQIHLPHLQKLIMYSPIDLNFGLLPKLTDIYLGMPYNKCMFKHFPTYINS